MRWILGKDAVRVLVHADVLSPPKPDLGTINLTEALRWGESHERDDSARVRKGTAFDYASIAFQLDNGAVGSLVLSHASCIRKGLAPELELHGSQASLAVDRIDGKLTIAKRGEPPQVLASVEDSGISNRFERYVFPAVRARSAGAGREHPGLDDGFRVQLFVDAAAQSAQQGKWVDLEDLATL